MSEWIKRSERLPEPYTYVLVANKKFMDIAYYSNVYGKFIYKSDGDFEDEIAHWQVTNWMPLPEMPEVEKDDDARKVL